MAEYVLVEKLGEGGFGEVWKAEHSQIAGKLVAIKFPKTPEHVQLIKREAVFQHELDHPSIVRTIGLNLESDPPYFIMEYFDGRNLRRLVQEDGIVPPPYAIDIAFQVLDALEFAHARKIVHKDIKPENILVDKKKIELKDGRKALLYWVKVTDLGLGGATVAPRPDAIAESDGWAPPGSRPATSPAGTMFYMAPEQMSGRLDLDHRADIYSVGVVLYEMLTGVLPLGMDLPSELNPVVPPELDKIVKRALSVDRDLRYPSCEEMKNDLLRAKEQFIRKLKHYRDHLQLDEEIALRTETPRQLTERREATAASKGSSSSLLARSRRVRRYEMIAIGMAVAVVLALAGIILYGTLRRPTAADRAPAVWFESTPSGAELVINNVVRGATPIRIEGMSFQPHEIRFEKKYYRTRVLQISVRTDGKRKALWAHDRATSKTAPLTELGNVDLERQSGAVRIETSNVEGAKVLVDGHLLGVTPFKNENFPAGDYDVKLDKPGYRPEEFKLSVFDGLNFYHSCPMIPDSSGQAAAPAVAEVEFKIEPAGTMVIIDDQPQTDPTPCRVTMSPGLHQFRFEKKGYVPPPPMKAEVAPGKSSLGFALARLTTRLDIRSEPSGATVILNGQVVGKTPLIRDNVQTGRYTVKIQSDGFVEFAREIDVEGADPVVVETRLVTKRSPVMAIRCALAGAPVYVDHRIVGKSSTTELRVTVAPGEHRVVVLGRLKAVNIGEEGELPVDFEQTDLNMVRIPAGSFLYGSERPVPPPTCERAQQRTTPEFWIDKFEVRVDEYRLFLEYLAATGDHSRCMKGETPNKNHTPDAAYWKNPKFNRDDFPVVGIDFWDAWAYAVWSGKAVPTEVEWEKAARGPDNREFPWGKEWNPLALNKDDTGLKPEERDPFDGPAPVGSFEAGKSYYGCFDMAGNAAEWCVDTWYGRESLRVIRGGSWVGASQDEYRVWWRESQRSDVRSQNVGLRCVFRSNP